VSIDPKDYLCVWDPRSNFYGDLTCGLDPEDIPKPRKDCHCDYCFYGKDRLALRILALEKVVEDLIVTGALPDLGIARESSAGDPVGYIPDKAMFKEATERARLILKQEEPT